MKKILVTGAGGFIGGHLIKELLKRKYSVRGVDIKNIEDWYQNFSDAENYSLDMSNKDNCFKMVDGVDGVDADALHDATPRRDETPVYGPERPTPGPAS